MRRQIMKRKTLLITSSNKENDGGLVLSIKTIIEYLLFQHFGSGNSITFIKEIYVGINPGLCSKDCRFPKIKRIKVEKVCVQHKMNLNYFYSISLKQQKNQDSVPNLKRLQTYYCESKKGLDNVLVQIIKPLSTSKPGSVFPLGKG